MMVRLPKKNEAAGFEFQTWTKNHNQIPMIILIRFAHYYYSYDLQQRRVHVSQCADVGVGYSDYLYVCMNVKVISKAEQRAIMIYSIIKHFEGL